MTRVRLRAGPLREATEGTVADFVFEGSTAPVGLGGSPLGRTLRQILEREGFSGRAGDLHHWSPAEAGPVRRVLVVGLGPRNAYSLESLRRACAAVARAACRLPGGGVSLPVPRALRAGADTGEAARAEVEGLLFGAYRFLRYRTAEPARHHPLERVELLAEEGSLRTAEAAARLGRIGAEAVNFARDLVSEPAGDLGPSRFAAVAGKVARERRLRCEVLSGARLRRLRMGGLLGVGQGSREPSYLVLLHYRPAKGRPRRRIGLVGKGLTFDSGGLSLKSAEAMETMKSDMAGAACVLAVMRALPEIAPPVEVIGALAVAENMPGGGAIRPGDVLRMHSGLTVEVKNTDAEGRLVLADALAYVGGRGVDELVDLATLTGACVVALGPLCTGVMGNDRRLVDRILGAARRSGEMVWPLPLFDDYLVQLQSEIADLRNTGSRWGGALTAALFLRRFVPEGVAWAHLDIAGPAFLDEDTYHTPKGPTGAGVRTLIRLLAASGR